MEQQVYYTSSTQAMDTTTTADSKSQRAYIQRAFGMFEKVVEVARNVLAARLCVHFN